MATETLTPKDRTPTRTHPISPAQLWKELSPAQQLSLRETLTAVCRQWLAGPHAGEARRDE
jgi:hypothetical protein